MKRLGKFAQASVLACLAGAAFAGEISAQACPGPVTYKAVISSSDLQNSSGQNLTTLGRIVRQDRANYHKWGRRDAGDEPDAVLADEKLRAALESAVDAAYPGHDIDPFYWDEKFGTQIAVTFWYCDGLPRARVQELGTARPAEPHPRFDRPEGVDDYNRELKQLPPPPP